MKNTPKLLAGLAIIALGTTVTFGLVEDKKDAHADHKDHAHEGHAHAGHEGHNHAEKATLGMAAPHFELMDQQGEAVDLDDYTGKIVVLEWFNDQCPFVKKYYSEGDMNELAAKYMEQGVIWLAIDSSSFSSVEENAQISSSWGIERPLLNDADGKIGKAYNAKTTPHMYIINADGVLVYQGAIDDKPSTDQGDIASSENFVVRALDELIAGESVSLPETKPYGCSVKY